MSKTIGFRGLAYFQTHPFQVLKLHGFLMFSVTDLPESSKNQVVKPQVHRYFLEVAQQVPKCPGAVDAV